MAYNENPSYMAIGSQTITQYDVLVGGATSTIGSVGPGSAGQILRSGGNAANPAYSTATYPATAGTNGNVLTSDGTNWGSSPIPSSFSPSSILQLYDDFIGSNQSAGGAGWQLGWSSTNANNTATTEVNRPGIVGNTSLTATTGFYLFLSNLQTATQFANFVLGGGVISCDWYFNIATLSTGTNRYTLTLGMGSTPTASDQVDGVYFQYSDNINSGNWNIVTASASSRTTSNSNLAGGTGWHHANITINAAASSVAYSMDGVAINVSPIALHIPTAAISPLLEVRNVAGTNAANAILVDLFTLTQTLTTPR